MTSLKRFTLALAGAASLAVLGAAAALAQEGELMEPPTQAEKERSSIFGRMVGRDKDDEDELKETLPGEAEEELGETEAPDLSGTLTDGDVVLSPEAVASAAGVTCEADALCLVDATGQPLRVLPRSFAALYADPAADAAVLSSAVSAFKPAFVFDRRGVDLSDPINPKGWYQVGYSTRRPVGWLKASDVLEWRQALLLEYIHPGTGADIRKPVLMFASEEALKDVVLASGRQRKVDELLASVEAGERPEGVIGREPPVFLNMNETFYFLPIIQWAEEESFDEPTHYLQVFAAVPGKRAEEAGQGTLEDEDFLKETLATMSGETQVDVVFVMDMTGSMQPYIDRVKAAVAQFAADLESRSASDNKVDFRFGLVGYRDSVEVTPDLEWSTKNFTPELVSAENLVQILNANAKAAEVSSDEWAEDVHGGVLEGISSAWREDEDKRHIRLIVLIGDASGHSVADEKKKQKNSAGMSEEDLNAMAVDKGIYVFGVYLKDDRAEPEWDKALDQFGRFARLPNAEDVGAIGVDADEGSQEGETIERATQEIGNWFTELLNAKSEEVEEFVQDDAPVELEPDALDSTVQTVETARGVVQAALVDWLGDAANPPKDFVSWVFDQDLSDINRPALGVRVLMTREQLDNVIRQSEVLLDALDTNIYGQVDFLNALKQTSAQTSLGLEVDPDLSLRDQEFLPKWVAALPYRSRALSMTPSEFANLSASERMEFRASLESKYKSYREIAGTPELWIKLDDSDTELQEVTAIPLSLLP